MIFQPGQLDIKPDDVGTEQEVRQASGRGNKLRGKPNVSPLQVAIVNDYELIVAGVSAMLAPYRSRVGVVELDVDQDPEHDVDVALFDSYGQPGLGLPRVRSLAENERVGAVAVYTWSLTETSRAAALQRGRPGPNCQDSFCRGPGRLSRGCRPRPGRRNWWFSRRCQGAMARVKLGPKCP